MKAEGQRPPQVNMDGWLEHKTGDPSSLTK